MGARRDADGLITAGITDHAQEALGDIVFIELPEVGRVVTAGKEACAVVESVKAASDIYAPVSGTVVEINEAPTGTPEGVNNDAYEAWFFRLKPSDPAALENLLDDEAYEAVIGDA